MPNSATKPLVWLNCKALPGDQMSQYPLPWNALADLRKKSNAAARALLFCIIYLRSPLCLKYVAPDVIIKSLIGERWQRGAQNLAHRGHSNARRNASHGLWPVSRLATMEICKPIVVGKKWPTQPHQLKGSWRKICVDISIWNTIKGKISYLSVPNIRYKMRCGIRSSFQV